jgi:alkanesulfonate monooxygenase SsuD/methylene tetrahydromethanopterin reductase-like flavin-dependent oxidoreductase (luciferase family)
VACGNPGTFARAGELGIGAIAFNFEPIYALQGRIDAYKQAIVDCSEPIGQFKNDNIMMTNAVVCTADRKHAREIARRVGRGYLYTMVCMYHDTMPKPDYAPVWPTPPFPPAGSDEELDELIKAGWLLCGTPEEVCEQVEKYQTVGCDQVVFGVPNDSVEHEEVLEMLELFGTKVIPEYDKDPVHSTTRYRETAKPKYQRWNRPIPDIEIPVLPTNALLP